MRINNSRIVRLSALRQASSDAMACQIEGQQVAPGVTRGKTRCYFCVRHYTIGDIGRVDGKDGLCSWCRAEVRYNRRAYRFVNGQWAPAWLERDGDYSRKYLRPAARWRVKLKGSKWRHH